MQRRTWLKLGIGSTVVLALAGGGLALMAPGLDKQGRLSDTGNLVISAVARAVLQGTLPTDASLHAKAMQGLMERISLLTNNLPPHAQDELSQLLSVLASGAGRWGLAGLGKNWEQASVAEIQNALQSMRVSSLGLKRQAYQGLHDIVGAAYFSDASTWAQIGYSGPLKI